MRYAEIITEATKTVAEKYITDVYRRLKRLGHANIVAYLEPEDEAVAGFEWAKNLAT